MSTTGCCPIDNVFRQEAKHGPAILVLSLDVVYLCFFMKGWFALMEIALLTLSKQFWP